MVGPTKFDRIETMKTVPYYKYATTLFDVMRRSMPYPIPKTLTGDELYALSAYILFLNKIVPRGCGHGRQEPAAGEDAQTGTTSSSGIRTRSNTTRCARTIRRAERKDLFEVRARRPRGERGTTNLWRTT